MDGFQHPDVARLARAVYALRLGRTLMVPEQDGPLGTICERFVLDTDPVEQELRLLHSLTLTRHGIAVATPFASLNWSIDALMVMAALWPDAMIAGLPDVPDYASERAIGFLRRIDAGHGAEIGSDRFHLEPRSGEPDHPCPMAIASAPRAAPGSATRLILMP